jgi:hypothetical protein
MTALQAFGSAAACAAALAMGCGKGGGGGEEGNRIPALNDDYVVLAWNDLGMHCLNPTYDELVILPPYNTVWAQVIRRGERPEIVTTGVEVRYDLVGNTYSYGKHDYGQFWDNAGVLFGATDLPHDIGLDLAGPEAFRLSGEMVVRGTESDHFEANGIPVVPVDDSGTWNPYQVARITVVDSADTSRVLAQTRATVPTSDEIRCDLCHGASGKVDLCDSATPGPDAFGNILAKHDCEHGTSLASSKPVLCASCHASPALAAAGEPGTPYLSEAVHGYHGALEPDERPGCYDCHPGPKTQCSRSLAHIRGTTDGNCTHCHGALTTVGTSITDGRVPWANEPSCASQCHAGVPEVDTGGVLYRNAQGHGGLYCAACHGSPHAMVPSRVAADNAQARQYQGKAAPIGDCAVCHETSRGGGSASEFMEEHGQSEHPSACNVCHTSVPPGASTSQWPHGFAWKSRSL